ncbi:MAG: tetratricopeptide repeat protein [Rhodanobacteraceae bacterium]|nr:MAG: tetratricopeptide repeat protein [Rhodanobacteraceae bacterium]
MNVAPNMLYEFGPFRIDPDRGLVLRDGQPLAITPKAFEVLLALVRRNHEVVSKDELMQTVWPGRVVEEANLSQCIFVLRKLLGDTHDTRRYIVTLPGQGYRFAEQVRAVAPGEPEAETPRNVPVNTVAAVGAPAEAGHDDVVVRPLVESNTRPVARKLMFAAIGVLIAVLVMLGAGYFFHRHTSLVREGVTSIPAKSIAVLPFENLSNDKNNAYFVAGMQGLILTKLADIGGLKVIARTSTSKYASHPDDLKTIGQQLGVSTILEGSVQKAGNQVLINVQLIDCETDSPIWAKSYTRTLTNVFGVEGDVAEKVASALKAKLSPAETARLASKLSPDAAANDLFLQAEYQGNQGQTNYDTTNWKAAIPLYQQAIARAPDFALAYARLSDTQSVLAWFGGGGMDVKQLITDARSNAKQALKLAPNLPAAHLALGYNDYWGRGDYADALKAFAAALALRPNDAGALTAQGFVERRQGRFDAAIISLQQASTLDPRNSTLAFYLGTTYMMMSRYPDAERAFLRAQALDPHNRNAKIRLSNAIVLASGDIPRALAASEGDEPQLKLQRVTLLTWQRKYKNALALLESVPDTPDNFGPTTRRGPKSLSQAELYRLLGHMTQARALYAQVLPQVRAELAQQQGIVQALVWQNLAAAELGLGHTAQAMAAVAEAQAINKHSHDSVDGPVLMELSAAFYAKANRAGLAVSILAKALVSPGIGGYYSPVMLWIDPAWDPIRHNPGFQALLKKYAKYRPAVVHSTSSRSVVPATVGTRRALHPATGFASRPAT